jgi:hypothetical protein
MKPLLQSLSAIIQPGMALTRGEVIRRYRMIKGCNQKFLQWLQMVQFSQLVKTESGEMILE